MAEGMRDIFDSPEFKEFADDVRVNLLPKLMASAANISVISDAALARPDVEFAVWSWA